MKPAEMRRQILVSYLSDVDHAREELQRVGGENKGA